MRSSLFWVKFARLAITVERDGIIYLITASFVVMITSLMTKNYEKSNGRLDFEYNNYNV